MNFLKPDKYWLNNLETALILILKKQWMDLRAIISPCCYFTTCDCFTNGQASLWGPVSNMEAV